MIARIINKYFNIRYWADFILFALVTIGTPIIILMLIGAITI